MPAMPLAPSYYILRDYLAHNPAPDFIVLMLTPGGFEHGPVPYMELMPHYAPLGAGVDEMLEYSRLRKDMTLLVNYFCPLRLYNEEFRRWWTWQTLPFLPGDVQALLQRRYVDGSRKGESFRHDWDRLFREQFRDLKAISRRRMEALHRDRGYYYIAEQAVVGGALPPDFRPREGTQPTFVDTSCHATADECYRAGGKGDPFLRRFFDLASRHRIRVLVIPEYIISAQKAGLEVPACWQWVATHYPNVLLSRTAVKRYGSAFFSDPTHVNPRGAIRYTMDVADEFAAAFGGR